MSGFSVRVARVKNLLPILLLIFSLGAVKADKPLAEKLTESTINVVYHSGQFTYFQYDINGKRSTNSFDYGICHSLRVYRKVDNTVQRVEIETKLLNNLFEDENTADDYESYSIGPSNNYEKQLLVNFFNPGINVLKLEEHGTQFTNKRIAEFLNSHNVVFDNQDDLEYFDINNLAVKNKFAQVNNWHYPEVTWTGRQPRRKCSWDCIDFSTY
jgi:hypothetical protein